MLSRSMCGSSQPRDGDSPHPTARPTEKGGCDPGLGQRLSCGARSTGTLESQSWGDQVLELPAHGSLPRDQRGAGSWGLVIVADSGLSAWPGFPLAVRAWVWEPWVLPGTVFPAPSGSSGV